MAGKFKITKGGDGSFSFVFADDERVYAESPVFQKEDELTQWMQGGCASSDCQSSEQSQHNPFKTW